MDKTPVSINFKNRMAILTVLLLVISSVSYSQNPVDFSGKWILNNSKSSKIFTNLTSTILITQNGDMINFEVTNTPKNGEPTTIKEKYVIGEGFRDRSTYHNFVTLADWSFDKQAISITWLISFDKDEGKEQLKHVTSYSLSNQGKIMIVQTKHSPMDKNEDTIMVYDKSL